MDELVYDRQHTLNIHPPEAASIVGCGGVGAWVAIDLAMTGVPELHLFDSDVMEIHNLNRLPFTMGDIGKAKVQILKDFLLKIRPTAKVVMNGNVTEITKELIRGVVVDCTDRVATQAFLQEYCTNKKLAYYRVGYDGQHFNVTDGQHKLAPKSKNVWDDGSGRDGYTIVPSWLVPPQIAAGLLTHAIVHNRTYAPVSMDIEEIFRHAEKVANESKTK